MAQQAPGALDPTFGVGTADGTPDGVVSTSLGEGDDAAAAIARTKDGKLVVAGSRAADGSKNIVVLKYNSDGTLDNGFGTSDDGTPDGVVDISLGEGDDIATAVAVQADDKVVIAGYHVEGTSSNIFVARLNADGTLDSSFGADAGADGTPDGVVNVSLGDGDDVARGVAVAADGKIVVVGDTVQGESSNMVVARFAADGTPDASFGADGGADGTPDGFVGIDLGAGDDRANGLALGADGSIVVAGSHVDGASNNIIVARLTPAGAPDATFGKAEDGTPDGIVSVSLGDGDDVASAVGLTADGKIVLAGTTYGQDGSSNFLVARLTADGTPDASFGADAGSDGTPDGFVPTSLGEGNDVATALALEADGHLLVAGYHQDGDSTSMAVASYTDTGALNAEFGKSEDGTPDGVVNVSLGAGDDKASGLVLDGDRLVVLAGTTIAADGSSNIALVRLTID